MRVYLTIAYYLTFFYAVTNIFLWANQSPSFEALSSGDRKALIVVTFVALLVFAAASELYDSVQGLRADFFDHILGRK